MRIRVTDIPAAGRVIEETLSLDSLNERMNAGADNDILFTSAPIVRLQLRHTPGGAVVTGNVSTAYRQPCARCLDEVNQEISVDLYLVLKEEKERDLETGGNEADDDAGIVHFQGDYVDIEEALQESIILKMSPFFSPPRNPDDSCSFCGLHFEKIYGDTGQNTVSPFGSLIKDALKKKK